MRIWKMWYEDSKPIQLIANTTDTMISTWEPGKVHDIDITFPHKFKDTSYQVIVTQTSTASSGIEWAVINKTQNGCRIHGYNRNSSTKIYNVAYDYIAIGYMDDTI